MMHSDWCVRYNLRGLYCVLILVLMDDALRREEMVGNDIDEES